MQHDLTVNDQFAKELRGFGLVGILAMMIILLTGNIFIGNIVIPVGAVLVFLWARLSKTPLQLLGFTRPTNILITIVVVFAFGVAFKLFMKSVVMPLFGADPLNQAYQYLKGNDSMLPAAIWAMLVAGFGEETIFRGYLFERSAKLLGTKPWARIITVLVTSFLFGLGHYLNQGLPGVQQATIFGLVFGSIAAITGRIWMLIIAHIAFDLCALAIIYFDLEFEVATIFFKPN